ncbi:hypothetical protein HQ865_01225 [Mucilaginibacter mali]|uniref:Uncharacterized protein n=1 Tax=Mucilaginibacter mali TaxID=2740462 RepID=A0A7D4UE16_9SPHI|nr:hypothetical protein [Mucilaginibacter mali]QKJ28436.1 hypothetical protein HQ865_01225 [Mucilaginibacter mali]
MSTETKKTDEPKPKRKPTGAAAAAQSAKAARLAGETTQPETTQEQPAKEWKPAISQFGEDH